MNLLFVVPNIEGKVGYPPVNVAQLVGFLRNNTDITVRVLDLTFYKKKWKELIRQEVNRIEYDLIGISTLTFDIDHAVMVANLIKKVTAKKPKIILGGIATILEPEKILKHKSVDFVCTGEGEWVLKELCQNNMDPSGILGLWYKCGSELIVKNPPRPLEENLDLFPAADWSDYDLEKYFQFNNNHLSIMASRGCPYKCTYCCNHALKKNLKGKYVRFRSVDHFLNEIGEILDKYIPKGLRFLYFIDDIFILDKKWTLDFCKKFKERNYHKRISWTVSVRANLVTKEIINALEGSGCYQVGMGIEAYNDHIRNNIYKRNMSMDQIKKAVKIIKESKLMLSLQFIFGAPEETISMMEKSLKMAKIINADTIMFSLLMPLPQTEIREICETHQLIEENKFSRSQQMYSKAVSKSCFATSKKIEKTYKKARNYQVRKYLLEGLKRQPILFPLDALRFLFYYKPRFGLELQNAFKFTVKKYALKRWLDNNKKRFQTDNT